MGLGNIRKRLLNPDGTLKPEFLPVPAAGDGQADAFFGQVTTSTAITKLRTSLDSIYAPFGSSGGTVNYAPVATNVLVTGLSSPPQVGQTAGATFTRTDAENDPAGTPIIKHYLATDTTGNTDALMATASAYVLPASAVGKFYRVSVTPTSTTGTITGAEVKGAYSAAIVAASAATTYSIAFTSEDNAVVSGVGNNNYAYNGAASYAVAGTTFKIAEGSTDTVFFDIPLSGSGYFITAPNTGGANGGTDRISVYHSGNNNAVLVRAFDQYLASPNGSAVVGASGQTLTGYLQFTATQIISGFSTDGGATLNLIHTDTRWSGDVHFKIFSDGASQFTNIRHINNANS